MRADCGSHFFPNAAEAQILDEHWAHVFESVVFAYNAAFSQIFPTNLNPIEYYQTAVIPENQKFGFFAKNYCILKKHMILFLW